MELNIELRRVLDRLIGVEYCGTKGLGWAHWSSILSYGWSWIGLLQLNIEGPSVSGGLIEVQY